MVHRRYYSPFEQDTIIEPRRVAEPEPPHPPPSVHKPVRTLKCASLPKKHSNGPGNLFANLKLDDIVLIALLLLLIFEENDKRDMPLIFGIGALLLVEFFEHD